MHGDAMLFVREDAVEATWSIIEPILGNATPVLVYEPGEWGPAEADRLVPISEGGIIRKRRLRLQLGFTRYNKLFTTVLQARDLLRIARIYH